MTHFVKEGERPRLVRLKGGGKRERGGTYTHHQHVREKGKNKVKIKGYF